LRLEASREWDKKKAMSVSVSHSFFLSICFSVTISLFSQPLIVSVFRSSSLFIFIFPSLSLSFSFLPMKVQSVVWADRTSTSCLSMKRETVAGQRVY
jgi:hypothetical protein